MKATMLLLMVCLFCTTYQLVVYQIWYPRVAWAADTLWLDYMAQRGMYLGCKNMVRE